MSKGKGFSLQVNQLYKRAKIPLELCPVAGKIGFSRKIEVPASPKNSHRVCVWGKSEIQKIKQKLEENKDDS